MTTIHFTLTILQLHFIMVQWLQEDQTFSM
jgi:hypothetical protein